jgi:O-antigen/teichoic acid export membrane protein
MAGDLSTLPSTELLMPIERVLFPAFVKVRHRPHELKRVFLLAQGVQCLVAIPASAGLALVAPELVPLMLGPQWSMAIPLVQILAVAYLASAMLSSSTCLFITLERVKALALFIWAQVGLFALLAFGLFAQAQAQQVAWLRLAVSMLSDLALAALLLQVFKPLRLRELLAGVLRPLLATATMAAGLWLLQLQWGLTETTQGSELLLGAKVAIGAVLYAGTILLLWQAAGQPEGAEAYLLAQLKTLRRGVWNKEHRCN